MAKARRSPLARISPEAPCANHAGKYLRCVLPVAPTKEASILISISEIDTKADDGFDSGDLQTSNK